MPVFGVNIQINPPARPPNLCFSLMNMSYQCFRRCTPQWRLSFDSTPCALRTWTLWARATPASLSTQRPRMARSPKLGALRPFATTGVSFACRPNAARRLRCCCRMARLTHLLCRTQPLNHSQKPAVCAHSARPVQLREGDVSCATVSTLTRHRSRPMRSTWLMSTTRVMEVSCVLSVPHC